MTGLIAITAARRVAAALALGLGSLGLTACGGDSASPDIAAGKADVRPTSARAATRWPDAGTPPANIGPNLDDAFRASRQVGHERRAVLRPGQAWITIAQPPMPRNLVTGQDLDNVAAYIASVAGTNAESPPRPAPPPTPQVPADDRQQLDPPGP